MAHTKIFRCPSCKAKLPVFFDPRTGGATTCACGTQIGLMDRRRGKREYRRMLQAKGSPLHPRAPIITVFETFAGNPDAQPFKLDMTGWVSARLS